MCGAYCFFETLDAVHAVSRRGAVPGRDQIVVSVSGEEEGRGLLLIFGPWRKGLFSGREFASGRGGIFGDDRTHFGDEGYVGKEVRRKELEMLDIDIDDAELQQLDVIRLAAIRVTCGGL